MTKPAPELKKIAVQHNTTSAPLFEVYHLSHDLRGPLNSILGFAELLLEEVEGPLTDIQKEDISAINQSAQNLLRLINTVVDVSKVDADQLEINSSEFDLKFVINEVLSSDFWVGKSAEMNVVLDLPDELPLVLGDGARTVQIFEELLAWAKLKGAGEITIKAECTDQDVITQLHLAGVILPEEDVEDIFRLLIRPDAAGRSHLGPGGLEIPLACRLAEVQQGKLWAESVVTGTLLYLRIPVATA